MDDGQAGQAECAYANPLCGHVEQVCASRQADDKDDVSDYIDSKRHHIHPSRQTELTTMAP